MSFDYEIISASQAIARFGLDELVSPQIQEEWQHSFAEEKAIVFTGDTEWTDRVGGHSAATRQPESSWAPIANASKLIVVNGNLKGDWIDTYLLSGLFVFGNLECQILEFGAAPAYIAGDANAQVRICASAEDDEVYGAEEEGAKWIRIDGRINAPVVRTWHMRLGHLSKANDCAEEIFEEEINPRRE